MWETIKESVHFNGEQYLKYMKYKDSQKAFKKKNRTPFTATQKFIVVWFCMVMIVAGGGYLIISILFPYVPVPVVFSWNGILMFLAISAGIAWMFHGFGFILIRR